MIEVGSGLIRPDGSRLVPRLPKNFTHIREQQLLVAEKAAEYLASGINIVTIQAQVGFGKSLLAELVRQLMGWRAVYITPHIQLQRQVLKDFHYARLIMGKTHYPHRNETLFPKETCGDCIEKALCPTNGKPCAYKSAKNTFNRASLGVCNLAYYLSAANFLQMFQSHLDGVPKPIGFGTFTPIAMVDLEGAEAPTGFECHTHGKFSVYARGEYEKMLAGFYLDQVVLDSEGAEDKPRCMDCKRTGHRWMAILATQTGEGSVGFSACGFTCIDRIECNPCPGEWGMIRSNGQQNVAWIGDYLTILDEADVLKDQLLGFVGCDINMRTLQDVADRTGEECPEAPVMKTEETWFEWLGQAKKLVAAGIEEAGPAREDDIPGNRWRKRLSNLIGSMCKVTPEWIYSPKREYVGDPLGKERKAGKVLSVNLAPLHVGATGKDAFWRYVKHGIFMSGTILSADHYAKETGLDQTGMTYAHINVDIDWHKLRRPVFRFKGIEVTKDIKSKPWRFQSCWRDLIEALMWIFTTYPGDRSLVHTVSHELAMELSTEIGKKVGFKRVLTHFEDMSTERREAVTKDFVRVDGGILFSAVAERGLDLPGDDCRNVVNAKCPWGNIGDKRVKLALEERDGRKDYNIQALRKYLQGCGRAMRYEGDWCRIFNIDSQIDRLIAHRELMPAYFLPTVRPVGQLVAPPFPPLPAELEKILEEQAFKNRGLGPGSVPDDWLGSMDFDISRLLNDPPPLPEGE